jgi:hypothetical protein
MKPLLYDDITIGMRVKDSDGDVGTIYEMEDIFNISIEYDSGGFGYICLDECCSDTIYSLV